MTNVAMKTKSEVRDELSADVKRFLENRAIEKVRAQKTPKKSYGLWNGHRVLRYEFALINNLV